MELFLRLLFIVLIVAAAVNDVRERRIPNVLTAGAAATALASHWLAYGFGGIAVWFVGLVVGGGLLAVPYVLGGMGAGDVKLLASAGSMLGAFQVICAFLAASIFGALVAIAFIGKSHARQYAFSTGCDASGGRPPNAIPYGLPLAVGVLLSTTGA
jgi:prepilin peptidase CpaA